MGGSIWQKNSLVTLILFDLCLFEHFSPVANFAQQSIIVIFYYLSGYKAVDKKPKPDANHVECSFDNQPGPGQYCKVLAEELMTGPCTLENHYGYDKGKPCVIIKLNKVGQFFQYFFMTMSIRHFFVTTTCCGPYIFFLSHYLFTKRALLPYFRVYHLDTISFKQGKQNH